MGPSGRIDIVYAITYISRMTRAAANADVFQAIADPTRRAILDLLAEGAQTVTQIVSAFRITQPAISQHLRVLREVGLVSVHRTGRQHIYKLTPMPIRQVARWALAYDRFREKEIDSPRPRSPSPAAPASPTREPEPRPSESSSWAPEFD
jgi:DNA-binding transcriptional ArsR family regulator